MTKEEKELDDKIAELYKTYVEHCAADHIPAVGYEHFKFHVIEHAKTEMSKQMSRSMADGVKEHIKHGDTVIYMAMRQSEVPHAKIDSVGGECAQCGEPVWIDKTMLEEARMSTIICPQCMGEVTGKTAEEIIADAIRQSGEL